MHTWRQCLSFIEKGRTSFVCLCFFFNQLKIQIAQGHFGLLISKKITSQVGKPCVMVMGSQVVMCSSVLRRLAQIPLPCSPLWCCAVMTCVDVEVKRSHCEQCCEIPSLVGEEAVSGNSLELKIVFLGSAVNFTLLFGIQFSYQQLPSSCCLALDAEYSLSELSDIGKKN